MATITVQVDALAPQAGLERLAEAVSPQVVLKVITARLISYVDESFRTHGRGRWRALAGSTVELRRRGGAEPLRDTGRYAQSFTGMRQRDPADPAPETDNLTYVEVGSNLKGEGGVPLAKIHEEGTGPFVIRVRRARMLAARTRAGGWLRFGREVNHPGIPARPVLPTSQAEADEVLRPTVLGMIERALQAGAAGASGEGP